jgi:hypothetical protein
VELSPQATAAFVAAALRARLAIERMVSIV